MLEACGRDDFACNFCLKMALTPKFLGAAVETLARGNLSTKGPLLADISKICETTTVGRRAISLGYAFLLPTMSISDFWIQSIAGNRAVQHKEASWQYRLALQSCW